MEHASTMRVLVKLSCESLNYKQTASTSVTSWVRALTAATQTRLSIMRVLVHQGQINQRTIKASIRDKSIRHCTESNHARPCPSRTVLYIYIALETRVHHARPCPSGTNRSKDNPGVHQGQINRILQREREALLFEQRPGRATRLRRAATVDKQKERGAPKGPS